MTKKILETNVEQLKIQKDDKAEVNYGYECGIKLKDASNVMVGDIFEIYQKVEVKEVKNAKSKNWKGK